MIELGVGLGGLVAWILIAVMSVRAGNPGSRYHILEFLTERPYPVILSVLVLIIFRIINVVPTELFAMILPSTWSSGIEHYTNAEEGHLLLWFFFGVILTPLSTIIVKYVKRFQSSS